MFGRRYFGGRYYGARYWGDGGTAAAVVAHLRTQIRDAVRAALAGLSTTSTRVYAGRTTPLPDEGLATLLIDMGDETIEAVSWGPRNRFNERRLELVVRAVVKASSDYMTTLNQVAKEVEVALAGVPSLGGLCKTLQLRDVDDPIAEASGEKPVAELTLRLVVTYIARLNAPQTAH